MGGIRLRSLQVEQGIRQLQQFLRHWRTPESYPGKLLQNGGYWHQLQLGVGQPLFEDVKSPHPHSKSRWVAFLCGFLCQVRFSLNLDNPDMPGLQQEQDIYLMDKVIHSDQFTPAQIWQVNYCWLYVQAVTLADIADPNGVTIDHSYYDRAPSLLLSRPMGAWPQQARPNDLAWVQW